MSRPAGQGKRFLAAGKFCRFRLAKRGRVWYNILHKSICGYSSSVERQLPKLHRWVRLPLSAPRRSKFCIACSGFFYKSQSVLTPLLLLSKPDPLRWAPVWVWCIRASNETPHQERHAKSVSLFLDAAGNLTCAAEVNSVCAKVLRRRRKSVAGLGSGSPAQKMIWNRDKKPPTGRLFSVPATGLTNVYLCARIW